MRKIFVFPPPPFFKNYTICNSMIICADGFFLLIHVMMSMIKTSNGNKIFSSTCIDRTEFLPANGNFLFRNERRPRFFWIISAQCGYRYQFTKVCLCWKDIHSSFSIFFVSMQDKRNGGYRKSVQYFWRGR